MPGKAAKSASNGSSILPKMSLFDGNDSSSEDDQEEGGATLGINQEFARRFEYNKKREERQRLEEKFKDEKSVSSSDGESEDDEGYLATEQLDDEITAVLGAIKNKDPRIYDKNVRFFEPIDPEKLPEKGKKEKAVTIKDYHRERYLKGDVGAEDEADATEKPPLSIAQQEEELKRSIMASIRAEDDDSEEWSGDEAFLKIKKEPREVQSVTENGVHPSREAAMKFTEDDVVNADKNPDEYLSKFMKARAWAPDSGLNWKPLDSDDEEDERADEFEHAFNMRFEDPEKSNEVLKSYSRDLTAARSVRREELTGRKKQRALEKERKEEKERQLNEERAQLRRLKLEEAQEKLAKIKQAAGLSGKALSDDEWLEFLNDKWDDKKWEEEMKKRFGEDYYAEPDDLSMDEAEDDEAEKGKKKPKKPKWDDDIDINDIIPDFEDDEKPNITLSDSEEVQPDADADENDDSEDERPAKKRKTTKDIKKEKLTEKRKARQELAKLEALVDSKLELENPRALASSSKAQEDVPRFRYRETSPNSFGLTARDILLAPSDAALNEFVGLKKLATFRDEDKKKKDQKRLGKKARLRQWRRDTFGREYEHSGPTYGFEKVVGGDGGGAAAARAPEDRKKKDRRSGGASGESKQGAPTAEDGVIEGERKKKRKRSKGKKAAADAES